MKEGNKKTQVSKFRMINSNSNNNNSNRFKVIKIRLQALKLLHRRSLPLS